MRRIAGRGLFRGRTRRLALISLVLCVAAWRVWEQTRQAPPFSFDSARPYAVERVVDGDTLLLADDTRVRLIGVDTPEMGRPNLPPEPLAAEASEFTRRQVEGREVRLEFDRERRDEYRRVLAYVWVGGRCLNEELIRAGYSRAETRFPYRAVMKGRFRAAEDEARRAGVGLWGLAP